MVTNLTLWEVISDLTWSPSGDQKGLARASTFLVGGVLLTWVTLVEGISPSPPGSPTHGPPRGGASSSSSEPPGGPDWKKWLALAAVVATVGVIWFLLGSPPPEGEGGTLIVTPSVDGNLPLSVISTVASVVAPTVASVVAPTVASVVAPTVASVVAPTVASVVAPTVASVVAPTAPSPSWLEDLRAVMTPRQYFLFELPTRSSKVLLDFGPHEVIRLVRRHGLTPLEELDLLYRVNIIRKDPQRFNALLKECLDLPPRVGVTDWDELLRLESFNHAARVVQRLGDRIISTRGTRATPPEGFDLMCRVYWSFCDLSPGKRAFLAKELNLSNSQVERLEEIFQAARFELDPFKYLMTPAARPHWGRPPEDFAVVRFKVLATRVRDTPTG